MFASEFKSKKTADKKKTVSMLSENKNIDTKIVIIRVDKTLRNENPSQMKLLKLIAI